VYHRQVVHLRRLVSLAPLLLIIIMPFINPVARAMTPPLRIDGVGTDTICQALGCTAQSLTTTQPDDVIVAVAECGFLRCEGSLSSVIDSSGLSFSLRVSYTAGDTLWEYFARAASPLVSDNITAMFVNSVSIMQVFAIHGANTAAIFDPSPYIPITVPCAGVEFLPCSAAITPSSVDMVIAIVAINDASACVAPLGFTPIGEAGGFLEVDFRIAVRPHSPILFSCTGTDPVAIIVDAVSFPLGFRL